MHVLLRTQDVSSKRPTNLLIPLSVRTNIYHLYFYIRNHGLRTPNEGLTQQNSKNFDPNQRLASNKDLGYWCGTLSTHSVIVCSQSVTASKAQCQICPSIIFCAELAGTVKFITQQNMKSHAWRSILKSSGGQIYCCVWGFLSKKYFRQISILGTNE